MCLVIIEKMDNMNLLCTVSLMKCDEQLKLSDAIKSANNASEDLKKDAAISDGTNQLQRFGRLLKKRTLKNILITKDDDDDQSDDLKKKKSLTKNMQHNEIGKEKPVALCHSIEKTNDQVSAIEESIKYIPNDNHINDGFSIQSSFRTVEDSDEERMSLKSSLKIHKNKKLCSTKNISMAINKNEDNISNNLDENDNFALTQKRGRSSLKKVQSQKTIDSKNNNKILKVKKKRNRDKPLDNVKINVENKSETSIRNSFEVDILPTTSAETSTSTLSDFNGPPSQLERQVCFFSKHFNIPIEEFKKNIVDRSLSVLRNKYCASVTSDMLRISPVVIHDDSIANITDAHKIINISYKIKPIKMSVACEKTNLKDLMNEVSKTMPSWSLSIVSNPQRYVISHMSIDMYCMPTINKVIVLDRYFRALVYINSCLKHDYCKRYETAAQIVKLITDLDDI